MSRSPGSGGWNSSPRTLADTRLATRLPLLHRDPVDRMIVAQCINRQATLITSDEQLTHYGADMVLI